MTNKGYFAGLFDGEGCIRIHKYIAKTDKNPKHTLRCSISITNPMVLLLFKKRFGGNIRIRLERSEKNKRQWAWEIANKKAFIFLKVIYPYLIIKKEEAKLAMYFQENEIIEQGSNHGKGERCFSLPEESIIRRDEIKRELSRLKKVNYELNDHNN